MRNTRVRTLVEIALTIALAAVLNTLKIWRMPNAGTVSFVMLPIIVLGLRRGVAVGLVAGALYGVVDFFVDPFPPVHWVQYVLDYPIAYAAVGLAGLFALAWRSACDGGRVAQGIWRALLPATIVASAAR
ncbi:MAG: energy-coupled thiamine transporter ThiT, partial [Actinomycetota bacterium]|nr:energy-coupled thiamine transporter ThiT [Actinomycetota bacterium]